jgi:hypothetical protein
MEGYLWKMIVEEVAKIKAAFGGRWTFSVEDIVLTYFWAVLHDRPVSWACSPSSWPPWAWRRARPSPSTMSRRLRTSAVCEAIAAIERAVLPHPGPTILHALDGKALPVSRHSQDRDARFGRGAGGTDKGYKLHVIYGKNGSIPAWEVEPLNVDERVVARRLVTQAEVAGYVVGDAFYDDNLLYDAADAHGAQLVTPRRCGTGRGLGHYRHSPARRRAIELVERSPHGFGAALLQQREVIERFFGTLTTAHYGLDRLPPWIRGLPRVRRWVQAKLIIDRLAHRRRKTG